MEREESEKRSRDTQGSVAIVQTTNSSLLVEPKHLRRNACHTSMVPRSGDESVHLFATGQVMKREDDTEEDDITKESRTAHLR